MTILVTGGRGAIARAVTAGLIAAGQDVRVGSSDPSALPGSIAFDAADPTPALEGVTQVFLYSSHSPQAFVAAAEAAGVKQVVLLSSLSALGGPEDPHAKAERAVTVGSY